MSLLKSLITASVLAVAVTSAVPASAMSLNANRAASAATEVSAATPVEWRRGGGRGLFWFGPGVGLGVLGGVIIGDALVAESIRDRRARDEDIGRCARDFATFDPANGTIIARGHVEICPYLIYN
jgi:hypothetical protein